MRTRTSPATGIAGIAGVALRVLTAATVLVSGYVHLKLWNDGFRDLHVIGPAFLVNAAAAGVIAVALVAWRHWLPPVLAVGFGASTLGAFVVSATRGLYGVHEVWTGTWVLTAAVSEAAAVLLGTATAVLAVLPRRSAVQPQQGPSVQRAHLD